jgi:hypothetical protein
LGRTYIRPWDDEGSIIDFKRSIGKLHFTVSNRTVPPLEVLSRKILSLIVTDAETPFYKELGQVLRHVVRFDLLDLEKSDDLSWCLRCFVDSLDQSTDLMKERFPIFPPCNYDVAFDHICKVMDVSPEALHLAIDKVKNCNSADDILNLGLLFNKDEIEVKIPAVVDGQVHGTPETIKPNVGLLPKSVDQDARKEEIKKKSADLDKTLNKRNRKDMSKKSHQKPASPTSKQMPSQQLRSRNRPAERKASEKKLTGKK